MSYETVVSAPTLPRHLLPLFGEDWAVWRVAGLRGAGFPADPVLRLAFPDCVESAERVLAAEKSLAAARHEALSEVDAALDALRENGEWDDKEKKRPLFKALRAIPKGNLSAARKAGVPQRLIDDMEACERELEAARESFGEAYDVAVSRQSEEILEIARMPRFQEAVLWQNRHAYHTALKPLLGESGGGSQRRRQYEKLVASYLQRYSVKNDTIGFFGPMGWARFVDEDSALDVRPGRNLVSRREIFLESWCFEAVARSLTRQKVMKPWLIPRLLPATRFDGTSVRLASGAAVELTAAQAALLGRCRGERTAIELAFELAGGPEGVFAGADEVYEHLEQFEKKGWIDWSFYVPTGYGAREVLEQQIERIADPKLAKVARLSLAALERCRQAIAEAAGDLEALEAALAKLDAVFEKLTGESATRKPGQVYAGRTLVYQECLRDVEAEIGSEIRNAIASPLHLVLESARWYTAEIARDTRGVFQNAYLELVAEEGRSAIDGLRFWEKIQPLFLTADVEYMKKAQAGVHERWMEILKPRPEARRLEFSSEALRDRVREAFACAAPGWQLARHHSPDVMVAARSPEALRRGEFEAVLGEIHVGLNTLNSWTFMALHPERQEVFRALDRDLPVPGPRLQAPKGFPGLTTRTQMAHFSDRDFLVPGVDTPVISSGERTLMFSDLVVDQTDQGLVMRTRDGRHSFPVEEFFSTLISHHASVRYGFLPAGDHWPRITIDRMIVCRESWSFDTREMDFCHLKQASDLFLEAQRWARHHGLPRFVFVKAPVEHKPFYLDLASPIYVEIFARVVRRSRDAGVGNPRIKVTEMVPAQDELWLPDHHGRLHCCELRVVVLDRRGEPEGAEGEETDA